MFRIIRDISAVLGLVGVIVTLIGYANSTYATKESLTNSNSRISSNAKAITAENNRAKRIGTIVCGIAIDLKLPTARKECNDIMEATNR